MATVCLAHDLRHDRPVAIKVLREEIARLGRGRGRLYYVMPFVAGETLRARLDRDGALELAEAVRLAS
jgi:serine/threonine-protein kinase